MQGSILLELHHLHDGLCPIQNASIQASRVETNDLIFRRKGAQEAKSGSQRRNRMRSQVEH